MRKLVLAMLGSAVVGCGPQPVANESASAQTEAVEEVPLSEGDVGSEAPDPARFAGRWTGVEGLFLVVIPRPGGQVVLDMQYDLDRRGRFDGALSGDAIRFERNGVTETLTPGAGAATGLKYLAGKADCLTVKPGEGYCRD